MPGGETSSLARLVNVLAQIVRVKKKAVFEPMFVSCSAVDWALEWVHEGL